jgi:hypothetical protein
MKKLIIILIILLTSCSAKVIEGELSNIEIQRLGIERMLCVCDIWNNCECDVILSDNIPTYNRLYIEDYIEMKTKARCEFYYE